MEELRRMYRQGLAARIQALAALLQAPEGAAGDGAASLRRIAHMLAGSGGTYGYPEITATARAAENSPDAELRGRIGALIEVLRRVAASDEKPQPSILVVAEPSEVVRRLRERLEGPERNVLTARTAAEAERILESSPPNLVLVDLILPDMDGRNLIVKIRDHPRAGTLPILVLSGAAGDLIRSECLALGADEVLEKSLDPAVVAERVEAYLRANGPASREGTHDPLTGLSNRALFKEWFDRMRALTSRSKQPLSLAILDLDGFKSVNDTYGHAMGDEVLRRLADLLKRTLRASDHIGRWGGEEFVVLLPYTAKEGAVIALEKALLALRRMRFETPDGRSFQVTYSAGAVDVGEGLTLDECVAQADRFLYLAKDAGRNRVVGAQERYAAPKTRIFIADDDPQIASVVKHRLEPEGFEVDHYPDGPSAYAAIGRTAYALGILDVQMPGMTGFELLQKIRSMPACAHVPLVMLTSMGSEQHVVRGFELGADDYIAKPFSPGELHVRVRRLLKKR
jgi:diguanylate cyclase (GGDEF)-like protein